MGALWPLTGTSPFAAIQLSRTHFIPDPLTSQSGRAPTRGASTEHGLEPVRLQPSTGGTCHPLRYKQLAAERIGIHRFDRR